MEQGKQYYAFISYSHKDEEWAKWLQHEFEHYHLPTTLNGYTDVPDSFRPIFRDIDELSGGELKPQISNALQSSSYLIIVCSPNSAKSPYVDEEIREFIEIGERDGCNNVSNIFPFIVEGVPHSIKEPDKECFPEALRSLPSELIAGDVTKHGRDHAFVKILSGTLQHSKIGFSMLWNQFERDRIEAERIEREKRDRLLLLESRFLSEKALSIAHIDSQLAKMLVLRALPKDVSDPEDRPYCIEAENALRQIRYYKSATLDFRDIGVSNFSISPDGSKGASASKDGTVRIWDMDTLSQIGDPLKGHSDSVLCAVFNSSGKVIASGSVDCSINLWDAETGRQLGDSLKGSTAPILEIAFTHNDEQVIASSTQGIDIWDIEERRLVHRIQVSDFNDIAIDKADRWIAVAKYSTGFDIEIYDLKSYRRIKKIHKAHSESLTSIDFSPDGERLVTSSFDGKFKVWDWKKGKTLIEQTVGKVTTIGIGGTEVGSYGTVVSSARFSKDGKFIVTASRDRLVRIWSAKTGEQQGEALVGHTDSVFHAEFSNDGSCVVSVSIDRTVRIWDWNPRPTYRFVGRSRYIPTDSKPDFGNYHLNVGFADLRITDSRDDSLVKTLKGHTNNINSAVFSPDGSMIVSTSYDGTARLWDVKTGEQMGEPLQGHTDSLICAAFSQDGRLVMTASAKELKVWDVNSHMQLGKDLTAFEDFYMATFPNSGGGIVAETKSDYDVMFDWEPMQDLIDKIRAQVINRQFSEEEKKRYYLD